MPYQNRVTPWGDIIASPARGTLMGNRGGKHHDPESKRLLRRWATRRWIACTLDFKGWHHQAMGEGYTSLFFLDEVTALAAGHRPCFCCRRMDATDFLRRAGYLKRADAFDLLVHAERVDGTGKRTFMHDLAMLPDGTIIEEGSGACALRGRNLLHWQPDGYGARRERGHARPVKVLTPKSIVAVLAGGYRPAWHSSAAGDD